MIHIATVHYQTSKWMEIQYRYLQNYLNEFRLYGFFSKNIDRKVAEKYHFSSFTDVGPHHQKLDILADIICHSAGSSDDIVIFLDSDAFPVAPLDNYLITKLSTYPLIAIRRDEVNKMHPHPAFCATKIKTWRTLQSGWYLGPTGAIHQHTGNPHMDTGGALMESLKLLRMSWYPLLRTNKNEIDSLLFGFYDSLIYHHGCGSKWTKNLSGDVRNSLERDVRTKLLYFFERACIFGTDKLFKLNNRLQDQLNPVFRHRKELERSDLKQLEKVFQVIWDDISCEQLQLLETEGLRLDRVK